MNPIRRRLLQIGAALPLAAAMFGSKEVAAQTNTADTAASFLLTVFLRHDELKTLDEINQHLRATGYYVMFPPSGIEVVSW